MDDRNPYQDDPLKPQIVETDFGIVSTGRSWCPPQFWEDYCRAAREFAMQRWLDEMDEVLAVLPVSLAMFMIESKTLDA